MSLKIIPFIIPKEKKFSLHKTKYTVTLYLKLFQSKIKKFTNKSLNKCCSVLGLNFGGPRWSATQLMIKIDTACEENLTSLIKIVDYRLVYNVW